MSALPALTKAYATRANIPFPAVSTQQEVRKSQIWLLKACLMNQVATGTLVGTRNLNSVWTCYYSCDGTTAGTAGDGVDRWGGAFNAAAIVQNTNGNAHSWIVLYNAASGIYVILDCNNATSGLRIEYSLVAPTGGTTTSGPTSTEPWQTTTTLTGAGSAWTNFVADDAAGNINWAHFTTADDARFHFETSRNGLGVFSCFASLWRSDNARPSDTRNWFALGASSTSGRGAGVHSTIAGSSGCISRTPNNASVVSTGGVQNTNFGGVSYPNSYGVDALTGEYLAYPMFVMALAPQVVYRGQLPDFYFIGTATVGASVPSAVAQERVVIGDMVLPFTGTPPNV